MNLHNVVMQSIEAVLALDIPDEYFGEAVVDQACVFAGISPDDMDEFISD